MNLQADPRPFPMRIRMDRRKAFVFANERKLAGTKRRLHDRSERVAIRVEPRPQALQKPGKVALLGQGSGAKLRENALKLHRV